MIPVMPVPPPPDWEIQGRLAGDAWLAAHPIGSRQPRRAFRPRNLWSAFCPNLAEGFGFRCGYTATYVPNGTVDHFVSWEEVQGTPDEKLAYDWANFRYADGWFNSARKRTPVPDPYTVGPDWFRIQLPSLLLEATSSVPATERPRVENALRWLKKDHRVMQGRRKWYRMYREGKLSLAGLREVAPLIASALERQPEFLLPTDRPPAPVGASR